MEDTQKRDDLHALIEHAGDEKYIVAETADGQIYLVSMPLDYRSDIARAASRKLGPISVRGGGILAIDHEEKTIKTYGMSGSYGQPDRELVEDILEKEFPEYSLEVLVTSHIRG